MIIMIDQLTVGPLGVNTYFVIDEESKKGVIIDPGAEAGRILEKIKENDWEISFIFLTHGHYDHIGAAQEIKDEIGCDIIAHKKAEEYLSDADINLSTTFGSGKVELQADQYITTDQSSYKALMDALPEKLAFKVFHAPGHTTDSIVFYFDEYSAAFVGDVIFKESMGRTDLHGGNGPTLLESVKTQIFTLPEDTILYPGHGPSTTVQYEKKYNPYFNFGF